MILAFVIGGYEDPSSRFQAMGSLHSGMASYYLMGLPFIYFLLPLLTGFACAYIAMPIPLTFLVMPVSYWFTPITANPVTLELSTTP